MDSSYSKNSKIVNFHMKFLFYRLDIKKLFRILDLLNKLYFGIILIFIASLKVRICRTFDKNEANANSKALNLVLKKLICWFKVHCLNNDFKHKVGKVMIGFKIPKN